MIEVRLTLLVTRHSLAWSKWGAPEVGEAIAGHYPVALSDGGYVHPNEIREFYPSEVWAAKSAAAQVRREADEEVRRADRAARPGGSIWFEERWYRKYMFWWRP